MESEKQRLQECSGNIVEVEAVFLFLGCFCQAKVGPRSRVNESFASFFFYAFARGPARGGLFLFFFLFVFFFRYVVFFCLLS